MKKNLVYTEKEYDTFLKFSDFLNSLVEEMDNSGEFTKEREAIIDKTQDLIIDIINFFPVEGED